MIPSQQRIKQLKRRTFLKVAGSAAVGVTIPRVGSARGGRALLRGPPRIQADVAVVGAGIAGLSAAYELTKSGVDSVVVLDARGEVGGRLRDHRIIGGEVVEGGAEWVGPTQTEILALADELGIQTFPTYDEGPILYAIGRRVIADDGESSGGTLQQEFAQVQAIMEGLATEIPLHEPWLAPRAAEYDRQTLNQWLRRQGVRRETRILFHKATWSILGDLASRISFLYFLFYIQSSGGLNARLDTSGGAQDSRIVGGAQRIAVMLAEALGDRVFLHSPVRRILHGPNGSVLVKARRLEVESKRVIVAMMPADAGRIVYTPALPLQRRGLMQQWPAASVFKANVVYETPFWRAKGLSGQVSNLGTIYSTFDNSPPGGTPGVLVAFSSSGGLPDNHLERKALVLRSLVNFFGPEARFPVDYVDIDWGAEPWIAGCVSPLGPGFLTRYGPALRAPVGRIYWAGSETSDIWNGKMDGAVRSGQRAAQEVLQAL